MSLSHFCWWASPLKRVIQKTVNGRSLGENALLMGSEEDGQNWLTKIRQLKAGKTMTVLVSLNFCCDSWMMGWESGVKNMKAWLHAALVRSAGVMMREIFSWQTRVPFVPNEHRLNATAYPSIVADRAHPFMTAVYPPYGGCFQQENAVSQSANHIKLVSWTRLYSDPLHSH